MRRRENPDQPEVVKAKDLQLGDRIFVPGMRAAKEITALLATQGTMTIYVQSTNWMVLEDYEVRREAKDATTSEQENSS